MSISQLINSLTMGCVCGRESISVDGRSFNVKARLGEGGFSYVDLVLDSRQHKLYALKRITCHSSEDEDIAKKEVQYMNMFSHVNLIPCEAHSLIKLKAGSRSAISDMYVVMPYYRRGTIYDELEILRIKEGNIQETRVLHIFRGICEGIKKLHSSSIAHRDIKPHNVMICDDDVPVLMDFGSMGPARMDIRSPSEAIKLQDFAAERCSMPYRPPELFNVDSHCSIDERTDIWSLGCTLYAMCFYESPFDAVYQRGDSIALAVIGGNLKVPKDKGYSTDMEDMMLGMMEVNLSDRPFIQTIIDRTEVLQNKYLNRV